MSSSGAPHIETTGRGLKIVIVAGSWHEEVTNAMIASAERTLAESGADFSVVRVPGAFELPVVAQAVLHQGADAVVALGVIIRGGTPHFEYIADSAMSGLLRVSLDTGKPVAFGVLTVDDEQQAFDRSGLPGSTEDKGAEAAQAALHATTTIRSLRAK